MLETIIVVLLILWLLGVFVVPLGSNVVHVLIVVAVVLVIVRLLQGRRVL
jgi:hypothetical protein